MKKHTTYTCFFAMVFSYLIACGGGGGGSNTTPGANADNNNLNNEPFNYGGIDTSANKWGFIDVYDGADNPSSIIASFNQNTDSHGEIYRDAIIGSLRNIDYCVVEENIADPDDALGYEYISAGPQVTINSDTGTIVEIKKFQFQQFIGYNHTSTDGNDFPEMLSAKFAGEDFPGMSDLVIPSVEPLFGFSHCEGDNLEPTVSFTWQAGTDQQAWISISATASNPAGGTERLVNCFVKDDGEFSIPGVSLAKLQPADRLDIYAVQRGKVSSLDRDGAAIALRRFYSPCNTS